jgi:hypothetical protein
MARQALVILIVVTVFGILVPLYKGFGFLDARIVAAYACLALLFVAPASAQLAGAHHKDSPPAAILGRIAFIVLWGWGITLVILATALITLNLMARGGGLLAPPLGFLAAVLTFSLLASIAIAVLAAVLGLRLSVTAVKNILRTGFLLILLGLIFGSRVLPERVQLEIADLFSTRRTLTRLAWELSIVSAVAAALLLIPLFWSRPEASFDKIPMAENHEEGGG